MAVAAAKAGALKSSDPVHPNFTTSDSPFYWLVRVLHGHVRDMEVVLKRIGLDIASWRVLTILTEFEPASVSLLAEHCASKLSTMTKTIQRLEIDGLVKTRTSGADARVTEVIATSKGRKLVGVARAASSRVFRQTFDGIDDQEIARFIATLRHMHANMYEFRS
jgi:DNA-binding MarR family transcriptional regulator